MADLDDEIFSFEVVGPGTLAPGQPGVFTALKNGSPAANVTWELLTPNGVPISSDTATLEAAPGGGSATVTAAKSGVIVLIASLPGTPTLTVRTIVTVIEPPDAAQPATATTSSSEEAAPPKSRWESLREFWTTVPDVLKALTGLITAITALVAGLYAAGIIGGDGPPTTAIPTAPTVEPTIATPVEDTRSPEDDRLGGFGIFSVAWARPTMVQSTRNTNILAKPREGSEIVWTVPKGADLTIKDTYPVCLHEIDWWLVASTVTNESGYVRADELEPIALVTTHTIDIQDLPSVTEGLNVETVAANTKLMVRGASQTGFESKDAAVSGLARGLVWWPVVDPATAKSGFVIGFQFGQPLGTPSPTYQPWGVTCP